MVRIGNYLAPVCRVMRPGESEEESPVTRLHKPRACNECGGSGTLNVLATPRTPFEGFANLLG